MRRSHFMRFLYVIILFYQGLFTSNAQGTIILNLNGMTLEDDTVKFNINKNISFCLLDFDISKDSIVLEYTSENKKNEAGIKRFTELTKIPTTAVKMINPEPYCFLPIKIEDADYSILKIKKISKKNKLVIEERSYRYKNSGGIKFDVSGGFFTTRIRDKVYVLARDSSGQNKIIEEKNGNFRVGTGILAHLHSRWNSILNLGFTMGFEINNESKISYLNGFSLFIGNDQKFVLSGGLAISKAKELSSLYSENQLISPEVTVIPTVDVWKTNWFLGGSYNF